MKRDYKELWKEFMALGWSGSVRDISEGSRGIKDLELSSQVYLRKYSGNWYIYYLPVSTTLEIPYNWVSIWSEFSVWIGDAITDLLSMEDDKDLVSNFGIKFTHFTKHIESNLVGSNVEWIYEELLPEIIKIGTKSWREWILGEYKIKLNPWKFRNLNGNFEV